MAAVPSAVVVLLFSGVLIAGAEARAQVVNLTCAEVTWFGFSKPEKVELSVSIDTAEGSGVFSPSLMTTWDNPGRLDIRPEQYAIIGRGSVQLQNGQVATREVLVVRRIPDYSVLRMVTLDDGKQYVAAQGGVCSPTRPAF
jgi:hypothetical protein